MNDLVWLYDFIAQVLPLSSMQARFMQQALVALLLLAPMTAAMGIVVVNFRMAFFAEAISHSAFTGVALGMLFAVSPGWTMPLFGLLVGLGITAVQRHSDLASDTVIGVFFSAMLAFGLAMVSRDRSLARDMQRFLYGDILTISEAEIWFLLLLFFLVFIFLASNYNRLLYAGINSTLARTHRVRVQILQYLFSGLLALLVMFSVRAIGVLLVTALLVVPAAGARNFSRSAGAMFWWAMAISTSSAVLGLLISAQDWARTATGATIILVACFWFVASLLLARLRRN
ncbi:MAG: metal ABC transporter permease [Desulfobulbaceae bacterium]|nr:metal ABC transporter permease [Desulfobulbaceae bacterium]